jgi:hypothetical protein
MVQKWAQPVEACLIVENENYFFARRPRTCMHEYLLLGRDIKGRRIMTCKPGIAIQLKGDDTLREMLHRHLDHVAIKVPVDAAKRWQRRTRRFKV